MYRHLGGPYFQTISEKLKHLFNDDDREIVIAVGEFWSSISRLERDLEKPENKFWPNSTKTKYVVDACLPNVLPFVLKNLVKEIEEAEEEEDENSAGNTISNASYNLLLLINKVSVSDQAKQIHMEFISNFIGSKNKWEVISSLRAY